jgi:hypothetical protein
VRGGYFGMSIDVVKDNINYRSPQQQSALSDLATFFEGASGTTQEKLGAFMKFVSRQDLSLLLARYEVFKQVGEVKGSILECGVYHGNGLMTWALLSAALEPTNYNRRIIGFDTFAGNAGESARDRITGAAAAQGLHQTAYAVDSEAELRRCIQIFDENRFLSHIPKIELVRGDVVETAPKYLEANPHIVVSVLSLSMNLFEPMAVALRTFLPRMPKGAVVAIHTLNEGIYPGATLALLEELGLRESSVRSHAFAPNLSWIVV